MAVYTKINHQQIASHLKNYSIGELLNFTEIVEGIDNSNFILETQNGKYILTIFEKRIAQKDLPFFINLKLHLAKKGINCPLPIPDKYGSVINKIENKNSVIVSFLNGKTLKAVSDGYYESITVKHCQEVGEVLAKMHLGALDYEDIRVNDLSVKNFLTIFNKFSNLVEQYQSGLANEILQNIAFLQKNWHQNIVNLSNAPAHLDLFPDNVFFENERLSGVIDFYFSANEILSLLDQLPTGYRTVFNLYVLEGLKHKEIAEMLEISINTSKSQLILAKKRLKVLVEQASIIRTGGPERA